MLFPWGGHLASAQPHDRIANANRLPRPHRQVAAGAVALVEEADHRDALRHRGFAAIDRRDLLDRRRRRGRRGTRRWRGGVRGARRRAPQAQPRRTLPGADPKNGHERGAA
ncbi:MAG TPA: hypothetical protein VNR91_12910 [Sphingomonas sp.]|nr:hypothetical protein [Sphingomonas sp.]